MSDAYHALSVRDKIREHLILAREARNKAGPMFRNAPAGTSGKGKHLTLEEMPPRYHTLCREAEHHEAAAKRLREVVRTPYAMAAE